MNCKVPFLLTNSSINSKVTIDLAVVRYIGNV